MKDCWYSFSDSGEYSACFHWPESDLWFFSHCKKIYCFCHQCYPVGAWCCLESSLWRTASIYFPFFYMGTPNHHQHHLFFLKKHCLNSGRYIFIQYLIHLLTFFCRSQSQSGNESSRKCQSGWLLLEGPEMSFSNHLSPLPAFSASDSIYIIVCGSISAMLSSEHLTARLSIITE